MDAFEVHAELSCNGMNILAEGAAHSAAELVALGVSAMDAEIFEQLAGVYFGSDAGPAEAQRKCVALAREHCLSIGDLEEIEAFVAKTRSDADAWKLRQLLITTPEEQRARVAAKQLAGF